MNRRALRPLIAAALFVTGLATTSYAWDGFGHMAVAYLAYQQLTSTTRASANALLKLNPDYNTWVSEVPPGTSAADQDAVVFMFASRWPDDIKGESGYHEDGPDPHGEIPPPGATPDGQNVGYTDFARHRYWHFVDNPFTQDGSTLPAIPSPNAQTQIAVFRTTLASPTSSDDLKSYDLAWLLHLVGDVHQPLHCATRVSNSPNDKNGDRGGNNVQLQSSGASELHMFWDDVMGPNAPPPAHVITFASGLAPPDPTLAAVSDETVWIAESVQNAQNDVYVSPIGPGDGPFTLTVAYKSNAKSVAEQRVALAGARLAALLNTALAPSNGSSTPSGGGGTPTVVTPPVVTPTATDTDVFINHNGHAYHLATCRYVGSHSQKVTVSDAKAMGRTACGVCKPPQ
jgi:hypothetical protein